MKKSFLLFLGLLFIVTVAGCETIKGLGQDIENTGENIWEAIQGT